MGKQLIHGPWPQLVDSAQPIPFPFESSLYNEMNFSPKACVTWKLLHTANPCASLAQIMMLQVPNWRVQNSFSTFSSLSFWLKEYNWVYLENLKGKYNQVCWYFRAHLCTNSPSMQLLLLTTVACICVFCQRKKCSWKTGCQLKRFRWRRSCTRFCWRN